MCCIPMLILCPIPVKKQQSMLSLNACLFKEEWGGWMDSVCVAMRKFLPDPEFMKGVNSQQEYVDFGEDILALIHTMESGWNINSIQQTPRQVCVVLFVSFIFVY